jgi:hypothetical protein
MQYQYFDIEIEADESSYRVQASSSMGQSFGRFVPPFSPTELENFVLKVGAPRRMVRRIDSPQMALARTFGQKLFASLFGTEVYARFCSTRDQARLAGAGVCVRLHLQHAPELATLPWEYLYDVSDDAFLVLSKFTPVVRFLQVPQAVPPLKATRPLRILGIISNPSEMEPLDVETERQHLQDAVEELNRRWLSNLLTIEWLSRPTLPDLQRILRRNQFHIFHFVGHGFFDPGEDEGSLAFEDEQGRIKPVRASVLSTLLRDHPTLRLAVLNACEGARVGLDDPFGGVGPALVRAGLPATVAMQFEFSDSTAVTFAKEFYGAIVDGLSLYAALADARRAIFSREDNIEWGTPVLFTRIENGILFQLPKQEARHVPVDELYQTVIDLVRQEKWQEAWDTWLVLRQHDPGYKDRAQVAQLAEREVEAKKLYKHMSALVVGRQWGKILEVWDEIQRWSPDHPDPEQIVSRARAELRTIEEVQVRQERLTRLYSQLDVLVSLEQWQQAQEKWQQILALDPDYPDPQALKEKVERGLAEQKRSSNTRVLPTKEKPPKPSGPGIKGLACLIISGIAGVVVLGALIMFWQVAGLVNVEPTPPPFVQNTPVPTPITGNPSRPAAVDSDAAAVGADATAPPLTLWAVDYFPTTLSSWWQYDYIGSDGNYQVDLELMEAEVSPGQTVLALISSDNIGRSNVVYYHWQDGRLIILGESNLRYIPYATALPERLDEGKNWTWTGIFSYETGESIADVNIGGTVLGIETVQVTAGTFEAIRVRTVVERYMQPLIITEMWLAPGVGIVKQTFESAEGSFELRLRSYSVK